MLDTMWAGAGGPLNPVLLARNAYIGMIETAQNVADRYSLNREEIDAFALRSQHHAKAARDSRPAPKEIMPVPDPGDERTPPRSGQNTTNSSATTPPPRQLAASRRNRHHPNDRGQLISADRRRERGRRRFR